MVTRSVVQSAMHTAATTLAHLPPEEWVGWVVYLCETLEDSVEVQSGAYALDTVMQEIVDRLQERLASGNWS